MCIYFYKIDAWYDSWVQKGWAFTISIDTDSLSSKCGVPNYTLLIYFSTPLITLALTSVFNSFGLNDR